MPLPIPLGACSASILVPSALASYSKILDPPPVPVTVLAAASMSAPSLGRQLEAAPATVTSAAEWLQLLLGQAPSPADPGVLGAQSDSKKYGITRRVSQDGRWAERDRSTNN